MEAKIEKMQEMFAKDQKCLQTEMKRALEGIYSEITEGEEWISELGDRTVEITEAEHIKDKRIKSTVSESSGITLSITTLKL